MSWENYKKRMNVADRLTLEEFGEPGFWIQLLDIKSMTTSQVQKMAEEARESDMSNRQKLIKKLDEISDENQNGEISDEEAELAASEVVREFKTSTIESPALSADNELLIESWNLTDFETGELLPIPTESVSSLKRVPAEVVVWLDEQLNNHWKKFSLGPKALETS